MPPAILNIPPETMVEQVSAELGTIQYINVLLGLSCMRGTGFLPHTRRLWHQTHCEMGQHRTLKSPQMFPALKTKLRKGCRNMLSMTLRCLSCWQAL